jgi:hypothetical protein
MRKLNLTEWAAASEIIGTLAVVLSLLFVAYSIDRNRTELRLTNDTYLYEIGDAMMADAAKDPDLAIFYAKRKWGLEFTERELAQTFWFEYRDLNQWEQAYFWHQDGLFSNRQWSGWDRAFSTNFAESFPREWWVAVRPVFSDEFAMHVENAYTL